MAFKTFYESARCHLFENLAKQVWDKMIRGHQVGVDPAEIGITKDIITEILHFRMVKNANFDVYAKPGWKEKINGSDMDVFVERHPGQYRWFALQAKTLKQTNQYDSFRQGAAGEPMQWEKLANLESQSRCKAYYLLYNGKEDFNHASLTDCKGTFSVSQFGCSLVEPLKIAEISNVMNGTMYVKPTFEDIHPQFAVPWRMLTCCYHKTTPSNMYTSAELMQSNSNFTKVSEYRSAEEIEKLDFVDSNSRIELADPITSASEKAGWNPSLRFIINLTAQPSNAQRN